MPGTNHHLIRIAVFALVSWFGVAGTPLSAQVDAQSLAPTMKQAAARVAIQVADLASSQADPFSVVLLVPSWNRSLLAAHDLLQANTSGPRPLARHAAYGAKRACGRAPSWERERRGRSVSVTGDDVVEALRTSLVNQGFSVLLPDQIATSAPSNLAFEDVLSLDLSVTGGALSKNKMRPLISARSYQGGRVGKTVGCSFAIGEAEWVDAPGKNLVTVAGPLRADPKKAADEAYEMLIARYANSAGLSRRDPALQEISWKQNLRTRFFLGTISTESGELYQAFLGAEAQSFAKDELRSQVRSWHRWQAWAPWLKVGGTLLLALGLWLAYLKADLRTNGYSAGRLRFLFGSLFATGASIFWGLPL